MLLLNYHDTASLPDLDQSSIMRKQTIKRAIAIVMLIASLGFSSLISRASASEKSQPLVQVVSKEWYRNPPPTPWAYSPFQSSNEGLVELRAHSGPHCLNNRKMDSDYLGLCSFQTSEIQDREYAVQAPEYVYKIRIHNAAQKKISAIIWEYIFIEPKTGRDLARHTFYNETRVSPGKNKTLIAISLRPPTRVVNVGMLSLKEEETYREQVEIKSISYADGSVWVAN